MSEITVDTTKVSERGQVVIPREIRAKLNLKTGSRLLVVASGDAVILQKVDLMAETARAKDLLDRARAIVGRLGMRR